MKKPTIPYPKPNPTPEYYSALKTTLDTLTGRAGSHVKLLDKFSSWKDIVNTVNQIISQLQNDDYEPVVPMPPGSPKQPTNWIAPVFVNSWADYDPTTNMTAGWYKDPFGTIHIRGCIKSGAFGTNAWRMPNGYIPWQTEYFACVGNNGTTSDLCLVGIIASNGGFQPSTTKLTGTASWVHISGIHYWPDLGY